jgi:hypothetical protein
MNKARGPCPSIEKIIIIIVISFGEGRVHRRLGVTTGVEVLEEVEFQEIHIEGRS